MVPVDVRDEDQVCLLRARVVSATPGIDLDDFTLELDLNASVGDGRDRDVPALGGDPVGVGGGERKSGDRYC